MDRKLSGALGLLALVGCGSGAPASQPAAPEVVVPEETGSAESDSNENSSDAPAPRSASGDDAESCAKRLRDGEGVKNTEGQPSYDAGLAAERAGDMAQARKSYFELIQSSPRSGLIPLAYLAFGELFKKEAESDPSKSMLAEASYKEVVKYPPPDNTAYGYAWLRLGDVQAKTDATHSLNSYKKAIEAGAQYPSLPCALAVTSEAKRKMVSAYANVGQPSKAHAFFKAVAGDKEALDMLADLAEAFRSQNKPADACAVAQSASSSRLSELQREVCKKP